MLWDVGASDEKLFNGWLQGEESDVSNVDEALGHCLVARLQQRTCGVLAPVEKHVPSLCSVLSGEAECNSSRVKPSKGLS